MLFRSDELHRFNKSQQDLLLPDVEAGVVRLIGCTTHNPGLYVVPALLSRSHLFRLDPLSVDEVAAFLGRALADAERGLGALGIKAGEAVLRQVAEMAGGDLRRALNCLETLVLAAPVLGSVTPAAVAAFARERRIRYDDGGDDHYDTASAFIKSVRGGDPDAALYWLFVMLEGGEEPRFIARRLVICASEDIGLADSRALGVATAAFQACEMVGMPECEYALAHATLFLALSPKSHRTTLAIAAAKDAVRGQPRQEVPLHLKDAHNATNKRLGQGGGYRYSHDYPEGISGQDYLARPLSLYHPGDAGAEAAMNKFFKEKGLTGDFLVRMTLNVRVGITAECKPGDHDAVLKVVDEVAALTQSKEVLAEIADLRERVVKVRDQDAERRKSQGK